jgi:hypothetical protein
MLKVNVGEEESYFYFLLFSNIKCAINAEVCPYGKPPPYPLPVT